MASCFLGAIAATRLFASFIAGCPAYAMLNGMHSTIQVRRSSHVLERGSNDC
jgi:hypothetical protein